MKRKFKLFATIASLCLSVALMAFGVYAATSVTYTATGSVTFDLSKEIMVNVTVSAEYATDYHGNYVTTQSAYTDSGIEALTFSTANYATKDTDSQEFASKLDLRESTVVRFKVEIAAQEGKHTQSAVDIKVSITSENGVNLSTSDAATKTNATLEDAETLYVYLGVEDITKGAVSGDFAITIEVTPTDTAA